MIKIIVTTVMALLPLAGFSQSAFDKFEDMEGVGAITINKAMFETLGSTVDDASGECDKYMGMVKDFEQLKIFTSEDKKMGKKLKDAVNSYLKSNPLEKLMSVKDGETNVSIYSRHGKDPAIIEECLIYIQEAEDRQVTVLSFTGNLNLKSIKELDGK